MTSVPAVHALPAGVVTLGDHEQHAKTQLDAAAWAYLNGGAADEITVAANRTAWDSLLLVPRVLKSLKGGSTRISLLGRTLAHPVLVAPVAFQKLAHADGELAAAYAAAAQGAGFIASTQASVDLESIARAFLSEAGRGPLWFQLYLQHDRAFTRDLVQRAAAAGYEALVLTVDAPASGARDRERRANFKLPGNVAAVNLAGLPAMKAELLAGQSALFDGLSGFAATWADIDWLLGTTTLPIVLKGVLHPDDARQAKACGVSAIVVSNHGGRTLDTALPTACALPRIAEALDGELPILVDGGIRRGTDVLKAVALGASAVLIGRPIVHGLANAGAVGVAHVIRLLVDELEIAMALTGCATVSQIHRDLIYGTA